jgi:hypothetical protein
LREREYSRSKSALKLNRLHAAFQEAGKPIDAPASNAASQLDAAPISGVCAAKQAHRLTWPEADSDEAGE